MLPVRELTNPKLKQPFRGIARFNNTQEKKKQKRKNETRKELPFFLFFSLSSHIVSLPPSHHQSFYSRVPPHFSFVCARQERSYSDNGVVDLRFSAPKTKKKIPFHTHPIFFVLLSISTRLVSVSLKHLDLCFVCSLVARFPFSPVAHKDCDLLRYGFPLCFRFCSSTLTHIIARPPQARVS